MRSRTTVHRGRWRREHRAEDPWPRLPFEVPDGCRSITVELAGGAGDGTVIDLGCEGAAGWRGWSGAARSRYVLGVDAATPGYLPGELEPGLWHVVLGLHRLPEAGAEYTVTVTISTDAGPGRAAEPRPPVPQRPATRALPAAPGLRWVATDLHAHTVHSDGSLSVAELAARAVSAGLDALAVTDHNTVSHHPYLPGLSDRYGVTLLPGQEVTTDRGHANAFGPIDWVDFRRPAREWVSAVEESGGLMSINHPLAGDCAWHQPLDKRPPLAEIWHSSWFDRTWGFPMAWWEAWGLGTVPIGGSDFHTPAQPQRLGSPVTWVAATSTEVGDVMTALRNGRTAISAGVDAPVLLRVDDEFVVLDGDGAVLIDTEGRRRIVRGSAARLPSAPGPHRLETPLAEVLAITP